jgi:outer membrane murein-binding lipoprotein Lpp
MRNDARTLPRRLFLGASLLSALLLPGCSSKGALDKPLAQVTQDDLKAAVQKMGWGISSATSSKGTTSSNFMVTGSKESPRGMKSPDGKTRVFFNAAVYDLAPERIETEKTRLSKEGPVEVSGARILAVSVTPRDAEDPQALMKQLRGK